MQTKTYFSNSIPAALEVARKELGDDALLVNSRPANGAGKAYGRLEVTFAYEALTGSGQPQPMRPAVSEMEDIRRQISELRSVAGRGGNAPAEFRHPSEARLCAAGFDDDLARELCTAAQRRTGERGSLAQELTARIPRAPFEEIKPGESRALAFIGAPGRGKTTSMVKIALKYGLSHRVPVRIYAAGAHGVGCQEQIARYATILGVPFQACESLDSLHLALNGEPWKGLILIDTPGISPADEKEAGELGRFFGRRPEIERHLVLRADARSADMALMVSRFSNMGASRLLFTGLDESTGHGAMLNTVVRTGLPAVFAGTGQQIPDDIEETDISRLVRSVCGENSLAVAA